MDMIKTATVTLTDARRSEDPEQIPSMSVATIKQKDIDLFEVQYNHNRRRVAAGYD